MNPARTGSHRDGHKEGRENKHPATQHTRKQTDKQGKCQTQQETRRTSQSCLETETKEATCAGRGTAPPSISPARNTTTHILTTKSQIGDTSLPCFPALLCIFSVQFLDLPRVKAACIFTSWSLTNLLFVLRLTYSLAIRKITFFAPFCNFNLSRKLGPTPQLAPHNHCSATHGAPSTSTNKPCDLPPRNTSSLALCLPLEEEPWISRPTYEKSYGTRGPTGKRVSLSFPHRPTSWHLCAAFRRGT